MWDDPPLFLAMLPLTLMVVNIFAGKKQPFGEIPNKIGKKKIINFEGRKKEKKRDYSKYLKDNSFYLF